MDTDSLVINGDLPSDLIGDEIGQFKLEHEIEFGIFIDPKVYFLKLSNGKCVSKTKGLGDKLEEEKRREEKRREEKRREEKRRELKL